MFSICVHFSTGMSIRAYMYPEFTLYKRKIEYTINISLGNRLILEEDVEQHRQAESGCDRGRSLGTLLFKGEESFFSLELFKKSFVPDSIRLWNLFKAEAREAVSLK